MITRRNFLAGSKNKMQWHALEQTIRAEVERYGNTELTHANVREQLFARFFQQLMLSPAAFDAFFEEYETYASFDNKEDFFTASDYANRAYGIFVDIQKELNQFSTLEKEYLGGKEDAKSEPIRKIFKVVDAYNGRISADLKEWCEGQCEKWRQEIEELRPAAGTEIAEDKRVAFYAKHVLLQINRDVGAVGVIATIEAARQAQNGNRDTWDKLFPQQINAEAFVRTVNKGTKTARKENNDSTKVFPSRTKHWVRREVANAVTTGFFLWPVENASRAYMNRGKYHPYLYVGSEAVAAVCGIGVLIANFCYNDYANLDMMRILDFIGKQKIEHNLVMKPDPETSFAYGTMLSKRGL